MGGCIALAILTIVFGAVATGVMAVLAYRRSNDALNQIRKLNGELESLSRAVRDSQRRQDRAEAVVPPPSPSPESDVAGKTTAAFGPAAPTSTASSLITVRALDSQVAGLAPASPAAGAAAIAGRQVAPAARPAPQPSAGAAAATRTSRSDTLESQIGGQWFLFVGAAVLVLGFGFFVKFAFDNHWINETARVVIGGLAGLGLVGGGAWFIRREYRLYGQILTGAGYATIFIALYAAFAFYGLIDRAPAFLLFAATAAAAAISADYFDSPGLALMAIVGGFLTPFLIGGDTDAQVTLLSYDALLVAGTMYLAHRRSWPLLNLASLVLTGVTFLGWADRWYTSAKYLPTEVFLVLFCAMFVYVARENQRKSDGAATLVSTVLWTGVAIAHVASLNNLFRHSEALLIYLTIATAVTVAAAIRAERPWVRLVAWFACVLPFLAWFGDHGLPQWRTEGVTVLVALYATHLLAQIERLWRRGEEPNPLDIALFHLNGLGLFAGLYILADKTMPSQTALVAVALAGWSGVLAAVSRRISREAPAQGLALAFGMVGFAIGLQFDDRWATVGWAAEATAIIWTGLIIRKEWMRLGGAVVLAVALLRLLGLGFFDTPAGFTAVVNPRVGSTLVIVAMLYLLALVHRRSGAHLPDRAGSDIAALVVAANIVTLLLVTVEITSYFHVREAEEATADLARGMSLSLAWGLYGTALVVVGIIERYRPIRYLAILLLALTAGKVLAVDLSELGGAYRIIGFIGMGALLLLGAYLYQRYRSVIVGTEE